MKLRRSDPQSTTVPGTAVPSGLPRAGSPTSSRSFRGVAWLLAALLLAPVARAHAWPGNCSQPASDGVSPVASDCLYVLQTAVGSQSCDPACACAPTGTLPVKASDALLCLRYAVGQEVSLLCPCPVPSEEDFNDNTRDWNKWAIDDGIDGNGELAETGKVLQYTCDPATGYDQAIRYWIGSVFPYATDWAVQVEIANWTVGTEDDHVNSYGLSVTKLNDFDNEVYAELYVSHYDGPPSRSGFYGELLTEGEYVVDVDTGGFGVERGAVQIAFDAGTRVVTLSYDADSTDGLTWTPFGSFGVAGSGGADANTDWDMTIRDRFAVGVYGFSMNMVITPSKIYGDDFLAVGGVMP